MRFPYFLTYAAASGLALPSPKASSPSASASLLPRLLDFPHGMSSLTRTVVTDLRVLAWLAIEGIVPPPGPQPDSYYYFLLCNVYPWGPRPKNDVHQCILDKTGCFHIGIVVGRTSGQDERSQFDARYYHVRLLSDREDPSKKATWYLGDDVAWYGPWSDQITLWGGQSTPERANFNALDAAAQAWVLMADQDDLTEEFNCLSFYYYMVDHVRLGTHLVNARIKDKDLKENKDKYLKGDEDKDPKRNKDDDLKGNEDKDSKENGDKGLKKNEDKNPKDSGIHVNK